jgi:AcrR family transcriptional regulator
MMQLCENPRVPKVVDHDARREELARAVRRVVVRSGVEGATVRAVAAEAGWSMGSLRYYFRTQGELLDFALTSMTKELPARVVAVLERQEPGLARAQAVLEQMLPLDDDRLAEATVYLAFMARARVGGSPASVAELAWDGERHLCGIAVADALGLAPPTRVGAVPRHLREAVDELQVFVDGLTFLAATLPGHMAPRRARALLRAELASLVDRHAR